MILIIRYSNKELTKKLAHIFDKLKINDKDMRHLAEVQIRDKNEFKIEIVKLREEIESLKNKKSTIKNKASI